MYSELNLLSDLTKILISPASIKNTLNSDDTTSNQTLVLLQYREKIRSRLLFVNNEIMHKNSKQISEYILFPVIASIDEKCKLFIAENMNEFKWEVLQEEFFQRSDGGDYVFDMITEVTSNKIYPKIVYEILLLVLQDNFKGKYFGSPNHTEYQDYLKTLKDIIISMTDSSAKSPAPKKDLPSNVIKHTHSTGLYISMLPIFTLPFIAYFLSK